MSEPTSPDSVKLATSPAKELRVALVGHAFMGAVHAHAWLTAPRFFDLPLRPALSAVAGTNREATESFARRFNIRAVEQDWRVLMARPDIDVVDICVPGNLHAPIATAALKAGKHVLCEKPLANSLDEAQQLTDTANTARAQGVRSMVGFNYRRVPAVAFARELVRAGRLGDLRHIRMQYLQDWILDPEFPLVWRLIKERAGTGALGDLGAHLIDLAEWVSGQTLTGVSALTSTFITERPLPQASSGLTAQAGDRRGRVSVDDAVAFIARTDAGALASFEATRLAPGRKNALTFEINGSLGSVSFDFERMNEIQFADATLPAEEAGFRRIQVTEPTHPYLDAWWPPGHGLGYEHSFVHEIRDFVDDIAAGRDPSPSFQDGLRVQRVLDAIERSAANNALWISIPQTPADDPASPGQPTTTSPFTAAKELIP